MPRPTLIFRPFSPSLFFPVIQMNNRKPMYRVKKYSVLCRCYPFPLPFMLSPPNKRAPSLTGLRSPYFCRLYSIISVFVRQPYDYHEFYTTKNNHAQRISKCITLPLLAAIVFPDHERLREKKIYSRSSSIIF